MLGVYGTDLAQQRGCVEDSRLLVQEYNYESDSTKEKSDRNMQHIGTTNYFETVLESTPNLAKLRAPQHKL